MPSRDGIITSTYLLTYWKRHGAVVCKSNYDDIFCRLSTMHENETAKQTDEGTVTSIPLRYVLGGISLVNTNRRNRYERVSPNKSLQVDHKQDSKICVPMRPPCVCVRERERERGGY